MKMSCEGKTVSWGQLEKYLEIHDSAIATFVKQQKSNLLDVQEIEAKLPKSFQVLHEAITGILLENRIIPKEQDQKVNELQLIVKTIMKLQSLLISQNHNN